MKALVKEGLPAVEPLLECLANDRRLTRMSRLTCGGYSELISVDEAALVALQGITNATTFGQRPRVGTANGTKIRRKCRSLAIAEEIRRYCQKYKGRTQQEAWLAILADSELGPKQWVKWRERS